MVGSRQSNLRSDNPHPTAAPPVLRPSVKFFAIFARILTAANKEDRNKLIADATLSFLREKVPRSWADLCDSVTDNFRVINPKEFRVMR